MRLGLGFLGTGFRDWDMGVCGLVSWDCGFGTIEKRVQRSKGKIILGNNPALGKCSILCLTIS